MSKSLFDHIKQITNVQNTLYWDSLSEGDKKTWSNYMVHRFHNHSETQMISHP